MEKNIFLIVNVCKGNYMSPLEIFPANVSQIVDWLANRGGLFVWGSCNLGNPGITWTTPASNVDGSSISKPNWQADKIIRHIRSLDDIVVIIPKVVKRFHVTTRIGTQGFSVKVSDGGSRKITKECEKAGEKSWYEFDYGSYENAVILVPEKTIPLSVYLNKTSTKVLDDWI